MAKPNPKQPPEESGEMDMSPMIDMVFLLLIFFIVNATAITVKTDAKVAMPVATNGGEVKSANGAIVLNVYRTEGDGAQSVAWGDDEGEFLQNEEAVRKYITDMATAFKASGYDKDPGLSLYIRGDQESVYKNSKVAIAIAGEQGIVNVMFATIPAK